MLTTARAFVASQREASKLVRQAENFSLRLPVVGRVSVPPPDQLAFFGVLGLLAAVELIDWPVALAIGVGQAVVARHFDDEHTAGQGPDRPAGEVAPPTEPEGAAPARKSAARKAAPHKSAERTATPRKAAARKATPHKSAERTATPRKAAARKATPSKATPPKAIKSTKE
ncbi:MAG: hypothetical protein ACXWZL_00075 [Mycobacterium sp.]